MSFDVKKCETGPGVAHDKIECRAGRRFFDDKLLERRSKRRRKQGIWSDFRNERDRTRLGPAQLAVEDENRKKRIVRSSEL
jgi:hypothetical protein